MDSYALWTNFRLESVCSSRASWIKRRLILLKKVPSLPSKVPSLWLFIRGKGHIDITWRFNEANTNLWRPWTPLPTNCHSGSLSESPDKLLFYWISQWSQRIFKSTLWSFPCTLSLWLKWRYLEINLNHPPLVSWPLSKDFCYELNVCVSPKIHMLKPKPPIWCIWR